MKKLLRIGSAKLMFSILFLTLTYTSCKKDKHETELNSEVLGTSISSAKESFEKKLKIIEPNYTGESFLSKELLEKRKLDWDNAFSQNNGDTVAVFVPVILSARITLVDGGLSGARLDNILYLRLMTTSKAFDGSKAEMITMIPDKIWERDTNFSGHMFIENWFEPNLTVVARTRNSTIPTNSDSHKPGDKVVNGYPQCYTAIETSCVGAGGGETCHTSTHTVCAGGGSNSGGGGGGGFGGGGGTGTPGAGGGGGSGGGGVGAGRVSRDINTKGVKDKYPCADKLVLQPIFNSRAMADFVAPFLTEGMKPGISFNTATLDWATTAGGGLFKLGQTGYDPSSGLGQSSIVTLNDKMMENSSPLIIAATTIHETMHAYINYNISTAEKEVRDTYNDYGNWMAALNGYYLIRNVPTNYSQHYYILTDFFNKGLQTLQTWDSTQEKKHTTKEMAMAMMYGLDTVDANCPQSYIGNINTAFDLLKKQFNISDTELNDFNKSQLVSIVNLPNSGCN